MAEALVRQQLVDGALVLEDGAEVVVAAAARAGSKENGARSKGSQGTERWRDEDGGEDKERKGGR